MEEGLPIYLPTYLLLPFFCFLLLVRIASIEIRHEEDMVGKEGHVVC